MHPLPLALLAASLAQVAPGAARSGEPDRPQGTPVTSELVVRRCSACHTRDSTGRLSRISFLRKTPEGWQASIRRMASLNDVELDPAEAREIVRYLANRHGLAPEELEPGRFEVERRQIDYTYTGDRETERTCRACHSLGRVITQRRTREEWGLLLATHRGYYPDVDFQAFRRGGPPPDTGDARHPMDKAIEHLARAFPLETPEWAAWSATMRPPRLEGTWALSGHEPGRGPLYGRVALAAVPGAPDEFTTEATYTYAADGRRVTRRGRAIVYAGYQWRGRSTEWVNEETALREVMVVSRDWREVTGRWFRGGYDELGLDVTLRRIEGGPVIAGVHPRAVRNGTTAELRIFGANLPRSPQPAALDLGPGLEIASVTGARDDLLTLRVTASRDAALGYRDLFLSGVHLRNAVAVYDSVHRVRIDPQGGMARVGGAVSPKQYQQFEALAYHNGPDQKPDTADDLNLGPVDVAWSLEEYSVTYDDDDIRFVGAIDRTGLFTPALDGPNPNRTGNRNNVGDVWVVATYPPPGGDRPLRARAQLIVTVPLYLRWEPWKVEP